jgi:hypothetical protein
MVIAVAAAFVAVLITAIFAAAVLLPTYTNLPLTAKLSHILDAGMVIEVAAAFVAVLITAIFAAAVLLPTYTNLPLTASLFHILVAGIFIVETVFVTVSITAILED